MAYDSRVDFLLRNCCDYESGSRGQQREVEVIGPRVRVGNITVQHKGVKEDQRYTEYGSLIKPVTTLVVIV